MKTIAAGIVCLAIAAAAHQNQRASRVEEAVRHAEAVVAIIDYRTVPVDYLGPDHGPLYSDYVLEAPDPDVLPVELRCMRKACPVDSRCFKKGLGHCMQKVWDSCPDLRWESVRDYCDDGKVD